MSQVASRGAAGMNINGSDLLPNVGETIVSQSGRQFTLVELIGEGGCGRVYRATCNGSLWAVKAEKYSKTSLGRDVSVLKSAAMNRSKHVCELFDHGFVATHYMYIVISLLGPDLYKLRHEQLFRRFSLGTAIRSAVQTLKAVEEIHSCGFLSRDVKPSNFAIGRKETRQSHMIFIFDFDLARKYINRRAKVFPSRGVVGWRGTARYASLTSHCRMDLGRKDDLESWFYMIVEFVTGALPWHHMRDRGVVKLAKESVRTEKRVEFLSDCPEQFNGFLTIIDSLRFETKPPYALFYEALETIMTKNEVTPEMPYDWQTETASVQSMTASSDRSPTLFSAQEPLSNEDFASSPGHADS